jgi:hypothetical protein
METLKVRDHLGDLGLDRRVILKWMLKKVGVRLWAGLV